METINNTRKNKVAIEIKKVLSDFLLLDSIFDEESSIDTSLISISDVVVSSCLQHAKIFVVSISPMVSNEDCIVFLDKHKSKLRNYLGKKIHIRYTPDIKFFVDDSFENAAKIEELFRKLHSTA